MGDDKAGAKPASQTESNSNSSGGPSGRLVQRTPRTSRALDPSGIYDARSMARRRLARRRRQLSSLLMLALAVAAGAATIFRGRQPRVATWSPSRLIETDLDIAALASMAPLSASSRSTQPEVVAVGRDGRMALLQASGQALPLRAGDFPLRAQPLVARGLILIGGEDGVLRAFDIASRRLRWQSAGEGAISGRAVLFPSPSTWAALPAPTPTATSTAGVALPAPLVPAPVAPPRSDANRPAQEAVAVGDDAGLVRAVRLSDGKLLWRARVGAPCGNGLSAARVRGGRVLVFVPLLSGVARRGGVLALDARDGKVAWSYPSDERLFAAMLVPPLVLSLDGQARLFCADDAGVVSALDAATGRSATGKRASGQWKAFLAPLPVADRAGAFGQRAKAPSASPSPAALGAGDGAGIALPAEGEGSGAGGEGVPLLVSSRCEMLWVADPRGPILVVAGNDGGVRAFAARSGRLLWVGDAGEAPVALVAAPRVGASRAGASIVVVTPHAVERRSMADGHRLARSEWGEEMGPAQAAASTPARLFVAARDVAAFDWASAPE